MSALRREADGNERATDAVTSPKRRAQLEAHGHWTDERLVDKVDLHAQARGASIAVVDLGGARQVTYAELADDVARLASHLGELGVGPGDVVSVQLPNWYETVAIDLAILAVGGILNPLLPIYRAREVRHALTVGEVSLLFTPGIYRRFDHAELVRELTDGFGPRRPLEHVAVGDPDHDPDAFRTWIAGFPATRPVARDAGQVSELIFTSGTEAAPKAIMHTEQTTSFGVRTAAAGLGLGSGDVVWMPSPIGHSTGFNYGVRMALHHGLPIVLQDQWSPEEAASLVKRFRCSYTVAATTFASDLVRHVDEAGGDISTLRLFGSGGAPVPPEVVHGAARHGATVLRMYGSTEALAVSWNRPDSSREHRTNTDGAPLDGVEVETRADDGSVVVGEPGDIYVRSPCGAVGFFNDEERTAATWDDEGWIRSGDIGLVDTDGYLSIVGRKKEIIIRGGLNIAPREIEDLIVQHPQVGEAAVVGLPDERLGEKTCACVVLRDGGELELAALVEYLRAEGMATFKLPQRLVVVDGLPKTPTGKVQKQVLVDQLS